MPSKCGAVSTQVARFGLGRAKEAQFRVRVLALRMAAASVYQGWTSALHQAASGACGRRSASEAADVLPVAFADYSAGKTAWTTLNKLLDVVLAQTKSQYGFIGHAVETSPGKKVMLVEAVTNITWHPSMDKVRAAGRRAWCSR